MNATDTQLLVAQNEDVVCIKIKGCANVRSSVPFKSLMEERRAKACKHFLLELEACQVMDSTFLGVLAHQAFELIEEAEEKGSIQLLNPNERILDLLDNLGVLSLFTVSHQGAFDQQAYEDVTQQLASGDKSSFTETSLHAHRALMALNPDNQAKFQDVTHFLEKQLDLDKKETNQS